MSASPTFTEVRLGLEHDRKLVTSELRRLLMDLASRAADLAAKVDSPREVTWAAGHAQGFGYDAIQIERDLAKLDLLNGELAHLGEV